MKTLIKEGIFSVGALDPKRPLFDALVPLPDGTSYNSYLIIGTEKVALLDTVDPSMEHVLLENLKEVPRIDYVIAHHAEQDHSGTLPKVLELYPAAQVMCSEQCKQMLIDHLGINAERIRTVKDRETLSLGNKTLQFISTPWVHWPETMCSYLQEDKILFSCDFFGSHLASEELYSRDDERVYLAAKRYYAEIMMSYRIFVKRHIETLKEFPIEMIAPSHGPIYRNPWFILNAYREWSSDTVKNEAVIIYVTMHGSTKEMALTLSEALKKHGITVHVFDISTSDIGAVAIALVDAATLIFATPAFIVGPHPAMAGAAYLINDFQPKTKVLGVIGSYAWGSHIAEDTLRMLPRIHAETLAPVVAKGKMKEGDVLALQKMADEIHQKHLNLIH